MDTAQPDRPLGEARQDAIFFGTATQSTGHLDLTNEPPHSPPSIADHDLLRLIGRGSYGEVWLARSATGSLRAVKIVYRKSFDHDRPYDREFEGLKKFEPLSHARESQVDIFHVGRNDAAGFFYYIMELADDASGAAGVRTLISSEAESFNPKPELKSEPPEVGCYAPHTLKHDLRTRGALPVTECIQIALSLTRALEHLHTHGLVHRDIKPSNIIFVKGVPKLADIGLVTSVDATRSFVGTEGYIPPEGPGTPQADLYSLGKVLYEIAFGKDRQEFPQLPLDLQTQPEHTALLEFNEIILKACATGSGERYHSSAELSADLALLQAGKSVKSKRAWQTYGAAGKTAGLVLAVLAVILALAVGFFRRSSAQLFHSPVPGVDALIAHADHVVLSCVPERLEEAWKEYSQAAELDPKFPPAFIGLVSVRMNQCAGFPDSTSASDTNYRIAVTNLIKVAPNLAETKINAAFLDYLDENMELAVRKAGEAMQWPIGSRAGGRFMRRFYGWFLLNAGRTDEALAELKTANHDVPYEPITLHLLGNAYYAKRLFPEALEAYQKGIEAEPRQYRSYYGKASVYEETREFEKAIAQLELGDQVIGRETPAIKSSYEKLRAAVQEDPVHGYWAERLKQYSSESPQPDCAIAVVLAHLGRMDEAYDHLEKGSSGRIDGLCTELCWDHANERFRKVARKAGFKP